MYARSSFKVLRLSTECKYLVVLNLKNIDVLIVAIVKLEILKLLNKVVC